MRRVDMSVLPAEKHRLTLDAKGWAKRTGGRSSLHAYGPAFVAQYLDDLDRDKDEATLMREERAIAKEVATWEELRASGQRLPRPPVFGTPLRRTPRQPVPYDRVEIHLSDRDYIRLRNWSGSYGLSISALLRVAFELTDVDEFERGD